MKKSLILIFVFSWCFISAQQNFLDIYMEKWQNNKAYTIECAEAMPAEKYNYKPTEEVRTFEAQIRHIMANMMWLNSDYLFGEEFSYPLRDTVYQKEVLIQMLNEAYTLADTAINNLRPEQLDKRVDFFAGEKNIMQILELMDDHVCHHRGQIIVYLRLNGIKPPRYRGW